MIILGLTGGIGMGKSTAANAFRRAGIPVFDADAEVHRLQAPGGAALPAIARAFPGTVRDGVLDRARLRATVLEAPASGEQAAIRRLETILHPLVRAAEQRFVARCRRAGKRVVVLDIPLLFETGNDKRVDKVVVVSAPLSMQSQRVHARGKMRGAEISAILALQTPDVEKRRRADYVIHTGLSRHHAQAATRRLLASLLGPAG